MNAGLEAAELKCDWVTVAENITLTKNHGKCQDIKMNTIWDITKSLNWLCSIHYVLVFIWPTLMWANVSKLWASYLLAGAKLLLISFHLLKEDSVCPERLWAPVRNWHYPSKMLMMVGFLMMPGLCQPVITNQSLLGRGGGWTIWSFQLVTKWWSVIVPHHVQQR